MRLSTLFRTLAVPVLLWVTSAAAAQAAPPRFGLLSREPKVLRYDIEKDEMVHLKSIVSLIPTEPPGGEYVYYGDRRTQFRYIGAPGRGGIYDALNEYHGQLQHNPRGYRYRRR